MIFLANLLAALLLCHTGDQHLAVAASVAETSAASLASPLYLEGRQIGDITVYPETPSKANFSMDREAFLQLLQEWTQSQVLKVLQNMPGKALTKSQVESTGLRISFNESTLDSNLVVPAHLRKTQQTWVQSPGVGPPITGSTIAPSPLSAFLNSRSASDWQTGSTIDGISRRPFRNDFEGALQLYSVVLEGNGSYQGPDATNPNVSQWMRGDVRLVKDFPHAMTRAMAGDLTYPVSSFQSAKPMGGLSLSRNFLLQPYRLTLPLGNRQIFLKQNSKVVVWVNGRVMQTLFLPSGTHDFQNLSITNGINRIHLEITDPTGKVESLDFDWISFAELLEPGLHQFSYNLGFPSIQEGSHRHYANELPTTSIFHRVGLSKSATVGASFQGDHHQRLAGLEWLQSVPFGIISLEPEFSHRDNGARLPLQRGAALRFKYNLTDYRGPENTQRAFVFSTLWQNPGFTLLDSTLYPNSIAYEFSSAWSQTLFSGISGRIGGTLQLARKDSSASSNGLIASAALVKGWKNGIQLNLTGTLRQTTQGLREEGVSLLGTWAIPESGHFLSAGTDSMTHTQRADWHYRSRQPVGGLQSNVDFQVDPATLSTNEQLEYTGTRASIAALHSYTGTNPSRTSETTVTTPSTQTIGMRLATSLVYAGGRLTLSRPVSDSFALVEATGPLRDERIPINPDGNQYYEAEADWFGPAVLSNVRSYQNYPVYIDPSLLNPGFDFGPENYTLLPTYRSGFLLTLNSSGQLAVSGTLVDSSGTPISLVAVEAFPEKKTDSPKDSVVLFTDRQGRFSAEGFRPGRYRVEFLDSANGQSFLFTIQPNLRSPNANIDLGTIVVSTDHRRKDASHAP